MTDKQTQIVYEDAIRRAARLLTIVSFDDPADLADVEFIFGVADEIEEKAQLPKKEAQ